MKADTYTKIILSVIAMALCALVVQNTNPIPTAHADDLQTISPNAEYGLVPLNPDGSIDVNVKSSDGYTKVDIRKIEGVSLNSSKIKYSAVKLPVFVMNQDGGSSSTRGGSSGGDSGGGSGTRGRK